MPKRAFFALYCAKKQAKTHFFEAFLRGKTANFGLFGVKKCAEMV
jgi:hypothetical protein